MRNVTKVRFVRISKKKKKKKKNSFTIWLNSRVAEFQLAMKKVHLLEEFYDSKRKFRERYFLRRKMSLTKISNLSKDQFPLESIPMYY